MTSARQCGWRSLLLATILLPSMSCSYVKNRSNDLLDVFWLDVDVGLWPSVDLHVTDFFGLGLGYSDQSVPLVNWHGRHVGSVPRKTMGFGAVIAATVYQHESNMVPILSGSGSYDDNVQSPPKLAAFMPTYFVKPYRASDRGLRLADVAASVTAGLGVRVGFSPGELLDFVLGFVGIDLGDDDCFGAISSGASRTPSDPEAAASTKNRP